jgi:hypothetical protein
MHAAKAIKHCGHQGLGTLFFSSSISINSSSKSPGVPHCRLFVRCWTACRMPHISCVSQRCLYEQPVPSSEPLACHTPSLDPHAVPICTPGQQLDIDLFICKNCMGNTISPGGVRANGPFQPFCQECPTFTAAVNRTLCLDGKQALDVRR